MRPASSRRRRTAAIVIATIVATMGAACSTEQPPQQAQPSTTAPASAAPTCAANPAEDVRSFAPTPDATAEAAAAQTIRKDHLVAGVSADTYKMSHRNANADLEGFDIDILRAIAGALFGDPNKIEFKVITPGDRGPMLQRHEVDIVGYTFTINCSRWQQ